MLKTQSIVQFLKTTGNRHLTELYTQEMEVQVNVAQDNGKRIKGNYLGKRWVGWTDDIEVWKSFRIPWNANKDPEYVDSEIKFNLSAHVEGIGLTGWNWVTKSSLWVGFDFDSIANHKEGLDDDTLTTIKDLLIDIPWITLVKSTSGKGLHLYIHLENPIPTSNHTEHAALARSILGVISMEVGFNLTTSVDACGMVLWVYHRKQENTDGLSLIKSGSKFPNSKVPTNWSEHCEVTSGKRKKLKSISPDELVFDELVSATRNQVLDDGHKAILKWFTTNADRDNWWDSDHNMLVCHTIDLKKAHTELKLKGIFYTTSSGSSAQNCFAFPSNSGSWVIRRHTPGVKEHPSWVVDSSGWTRCVYNALADFIACARAHSGIENAKGDYVFPTIEIGLKALSDIGIVNIDVPVPHMGRTLFIKEKSDGKLILSYDRDKLDMPTVGWVLNTKGDRWERVIHRIKHKKDVVAPDHLVRHVISNNTEAGWFILTNKKWIQQCRSNVITVLLSQHGVSNRTDIELVMSKAILSPWELINLPFSDEYPGDRRWNKDAATLSIKPEEGSHKTWDEILKHCGSSLDETVSNDPWCIENAINDGSEYLLCWIASMFQRPTEPLPYLFFIGPQNCGKSTLHEALSHLMKRGYVRADNALINQQGFNAEIGNAILCIVEETDLRRNRDALNRIKDWVTGQTISINTKHKTVFDMVNTCHWMQCANDLSYCPVFPGDTRIVVCRVDMPKRDIPKTELFCALDREKAAFLNTLLSIELPPAPGRLAIPCIHTAEKRELEQYNSTSLQQFIKEHTKVCKGHRILFEEFYNKFTLSLTGEERNVWSSNKVSRMYPKEYPYCKGKMDMNNATWVGNITFDLDAVEEKFELFINHNGRLDRKAIV